MPFSYNRIYLSFNISNFLSAVLDTCAKLFTVYSKLDVERNRHIEGTGLGLSICRSLAEMMNGDVSVNSVYGKGSKFTVKIKQEIVENIPVGIRTAQNLESFKFITYGRERRKGGPCFQLPYAKALVVDDVTFNLDVAKGMLMPYNMRIDCVTSGQEAIDIVKMSKVKYDIIFMDHMMPEMDGIQAVDIIRTEINTDYAKTVPIVALTANAIIGNEEMFINNGFQDYLTKPIDVARLDAILNRLVRNMDEEENINNEALKLSSNDSQINLKTYIIDGLDIIEGLGRLGNREQAFFSILKSFVSTMPKLLEEIKVCSKETLNDYTIKVHGIKGACYGIGAHKVGKQAEELEIAARNENITTIRLQNDILIKNAEILITNINKLLKES